MYLFVFSILVTVLAACVTSREEKERIATNSDKDIGAWVTGDYTTAVGA